MARTSVELRNFRRKHVRSKVRGSSQRPRLAVFRSQKHTYAQLIDDDAGRTLASASTQEKSAEAKGCDLTSATLVGARIAERAKSQNIDQVVFDRGGFRYHGRVKAVAEAAREKGLRF